MASFYGFTYHPPKEKRNQPRFELEKNNLDEATKYWLMPFNHNHLRITRIIRSCRILGLEPEALIFHDAVSRAAKQKLGKKVERSLMYWKRAAERPLYLAPEDDKDIGQGKDFLYRFEEEKRMQDKADGEAGN
ncbi:MAG: hypothetical protein Q9218_008189 [Villophora microphyllina]